MNVIHEIQTSDWQNNFSQHIGMQAIKELESGKILLMPQLAFNLLPHEHHLLSPHLTHPKVKQISFDIKSHKVSGAQCDTENYNHIKILLQRYANSAHQFVKELLSSYANYLIIGRTSLRTIEIAGRVSSYRKDDTRLHVDAFPSSPVQGHRILRIFTNINPDGINRIWRTGEHFNDVANRFLPLTRKPIPGSAHLLKFLKITKSYRSEYDHIMLEIHNRMKADTNYQTSVTQSEIKFATGNSWIVQTDHVSHAALSGCHVLEQTFYLPINAMHNPQLSPLLVLEKLCRKKLI